MIARNVTAEQIRQAGAEVGVEVCGPTASGRGFRFTLKPKNYYEDGRPQRERKYMRKGFQRRADGERRATFSLCWHGHRDFFRALYRLAPNAKIRTALAVYTSAEQFERAYPGSDKQIGSMMDPMYMSEACWCEE